MLPNIVLLLLWLFLIELLMFQKKKIDDGISFLPGNQPTNPDSIRIAIPGTSSSILALCIVECHLNSNAVPRTGPGVGVVVVFVSPDIY